MMCGGVWAPFGGGRIVISTVHSSGIEFFEHPFLVPADCIALSETVRERIRRGIDTRSTNRYAGSTIATNNAWSDEAVDVAVRTLAKADPLRDSLTLYWEHVKKDTLRRLGRVRRIAEACYADPTLLGKVVI